MMHSRFDIVRQALVVACASVAIVGVGYVFAAPTAPPPGSAVPLPLTRGANAETKTGPLTLSGGLTVSGGSGLCLGGVCKTAWPTTTVQVGTTTVTGQQNITTTSYTYYGSDYYYYWYQNQQYSQSNYYYWADQNFSVSIPVTAGAPISASGSTGVRCYSANYNFTYTPAPTSGYYQSSIYTLATNVTYSVSGTNVVVSGTCRVYMQNGPYNYHYSVVPVTASVTYIY